ncbi:MAG: replication initiation protein, partial [Clostridium celatum]|nr:replication initiation protein [Clostridium celatum]
MEKEQTLTLQKNRNSLDTMQLKIHNQMARTLARFEEPEHAKLFLISLGSLLKSEDNIAHIKKVELFDKLGITDEQRHTRYFKLFNNMRKRTEFDITIDEDTQIAGNIISLVKRTRNEYLIKFEEEIAPTLKQLKGQYTLLYIDSIMQFRSSYSITLYNYLLSWYNKDYKVNKQWLSTKQLKELFGLTEEDYMNKKSGRFDRYNFEKRTIQVAVDEITKAGYMYIRWYKAKDKLTKKVIAYVFEFLVLDHDKEKANGIEFTEIKGGKIDDIIIADEEELQAEAEWERYNALPEWEKELEGCCELCDNNFTKTEMQEFIGMMNKLPLSQMQNSIADDITVHRMDYIIDKYRT